MEDLSEKANLLFFVLLADGSIVDRPVPRTDDRRPRRNIAVSGQRIRRSDAAYSVVNQQGPGDGPQTGTTTATELAPRTYEPTLALERKSVR